MQPIQYTPHEYQKTAIAFAVQNECFGLFLDPGLGKTSVSMSVIKQLRMLNKIKGALIVAPLRVVYSVWPAEAKKWKQFNKLSVGILHGPKKDKVLAEKHDIYVINPEGIKWLFTKGLHRKSNWPFDMLLIDESTKFKNPDAKRLRYMKKKLYKFKRRGILTGTPAPRSLLDLYGQMLLLDEGETFGSRIGQFKERFFYHTGYKGYQLELKPGAEESIYRKIAPYVLRMSAEDHLDMPEKVFNDIWVDLPKDAREKYDEFEKELFMEIDNDEVNAINNSVLYGKCQQIANGGIYKDQDPLEKKLSAKQRGWYNIHNAKTEALRDIVDELRGKPVLVSYNFHHDLVRLQKEFGTAKKQIPFIGSGVSGKEGDKIANQWNSGKINMLFGHPASMGHGLNIQNQGNDVVFYSLTDDFENFEQFYRRIYRQGVKGSQVRIHLIMARDTVDEAIWAKLQKKDDNQQSLLHYLKQYRNKKRS